MKEEDKFIGDIKTDSPLMDDKGFDELIGKSKVAPKAEEAISEEDEEKPKPRRYRRLEEKYQAEREANIALNARLQALSEVEKYAKEHSDIDPDLAKIFNPKDEQGKILLDVFQKKFAEVREQSKADMRAEMEAEQSKLSEAEAETQQEVDSAFDGLEDKFGVNLNDPKTKAERDFVNGFVDFMEDISPKDRNGEIKEYADFERGFETYSRLASKDKPRETSDRQKELASRTMTQGGRPVVEAPKGPITFKSVGRMIERMRDQSN